MFNLNSSMLAYAPTKYLGVVGTDWGPYFKAKVDAHVAGTFQGENSWLGVEDDVVFTADWNADIPADMVAQITERQAPSRMAVSSCSRGRCRSGRDGTLCRRRGDDDG